MHLECSLLGVSINYLLVANAGSGVILVDSVSQSVIMSFHCPSAAAKVCTVSWLTNAPGMFITGGKYKLSVSGQCW